MMMLTAEDWRLPGCDERCQLRTVISVGVMRRGFQPVHDPDAHEEYGRTSAIGAAEIIVSTGPLAINLTARSVTLGDKELLLTNREWEALAYLAEARGGYRTVRDLARMHFGPIDPNPCDMNTVRNNINRLRGRLGDARVLLDTTPIRGYRLLMLPAGDPLPTNAHRWAAYYDACVRCGQNNSRHAGHGMCEPCARWSRGQRAESAS